MEIPHCNTDFSASVHLPVIKSTYGFIW